MKTIVLDDDPTGTQSATGVSVLFETDVDMLADALRAADSVYVQTNSRALSQDAAVALVAKIRADGEGAAQELGEQVRFVLRGDSTLRGHVFAESSVFMDDDAVLLFVPAFPAGGRTTRGGVHFVRVGDEELPADQSEYAQDPVFGFATGVLVDYVAQKSGRSAVSVALDEVRAGGVLQVLVDAPAGSVVLPDVVNEDDVRAVADAVNAVAGHGRRVVVRCAAPLAAELAGVTSRGLLPVPLVERPVRALLVCGSHTLGASAQLAPIAEAWGSPVLVDTATALLDAAAEGAVAADSARAAFAQAPVVLLATERVRSAEHNTLDHGERVMTALTTAVADLLPQVDVVVAKGGITSAEVARTGIGATSALVLGQVLPGVSVWQLEDRTGRQVLYVVVPGNVGGPDTLTRVLDALGVRVAVR
ncbi:four-carbon acid sugar kinase family protein [Pedococcus sp. 5OH_020]|uniref:four-carbon acid sugar kinase family protein n=1 Tax=Pedococcus sp. 5OH_020 TaxID=2989814 RepID=UPI0022E9FEA1|nr:four-carbon acid sugar kinase family protein [Pedococcus sp. 5OH_020]